MKKVKLKLVEAHNIQYGKLLPGSFSFTKELKSTDRITAYDPKNNVFLDDILLKDFKHKKHMLVMKDQHFKVLKVLDQ